jgi:4-hydroxy-3-polyprenylbenzoate decarboxylase
MSSEAAMSEKDVIVGVTGASGAVYTHALVMELLGQGLTVHFIPTVHATAVWRDEIEGRASAIVKKNPRRADWSARLGVHPHDDERLVVYDDYNVAAPPASGTFRPRAMVVMPCSMNTLAKIAHGIADTLLTRAAGVCLKERRRLVLGVREAPMSLVDLRNQVAAAEAGATILPAAPAFYHRPKSIDDLVAFVISKTCDQLGVACSRPIRYRRKK